MLNIPTIADKAFSTVKTVEEIADSSGMLPEQGFIFRAFEMCPMSATKIVILGQDPYPTPGDAIGLAFAVGEGRRLPKSLVNIFKELKSDTGVDRTNGDLTDWAEQGILLANTALTVIAGTPGAHSDLWRDFTQSWITLLGAREKPCVWILWGNHAQEFEKLISPHHHIIKSAHPSPLSSWRGFFGSKPFSMANQYLREMGEAEIRW